MSSARHNFHLQSYAIGAWFIACALILPGTLACGSRTVGADFGCPGPDLLTTPLQGANPALGDGTCIFEEEQGGRRHRIVCDGQACLWFVDDEMICECQQLDYANRCGNGVPTCVEWQDSFDYR